MENKKEYIDNSTFLADWIAGKLSDTELKELVSEQDFYTYKKLQTVFNFLEKPNFETETNFASLKQKLKPKQTLVKKLLPNWIYTAAAIVMLFFGVYQILQLDVESKTQHGQTQLVILDQGTSIQLNAMSSITYSKYLSQRNIFLKGEAFFEVTKKGNFTVETTNGTISVLGTKFNVISIDNYIEVTCLEGKLAVTPLNGVKQILTQNMSWRSIDGKQETRESKVETIGWLNAESSFVSVPISIVLKSLENQYNVVLKTDKIDDQIRYTGSFSHNNLNSALKSICLPLGMQFKIKENNIIVLYVD